MILRLTAVAAALAVLAAGCGSNGPSRRDVVTDYIEQVNLIQVSLATPAKAISNASAALARKGGYDAAAAARLRRAARTIEGLRERLAALETPAEARRLRALLLEVSDLEASLAREIAALTTFLPAFTEVLRPLEPAGKKLQAKLEAKTPADEKADALVAYRETAGDVSRQLRVLEPPAVSKPTLTTQLDTLDRVSTVAASFARALRAGDAKAVSQLLVRFNEATASGQSLAAQRARINAVKAYNARVRRLGELQARINRERNRLQKSLE